MTVQKSGLDGTIFGQVRRVAEFGPLRVDAFWPKRVERIFKTVPISTHTSTRFGPNAVIKMSQTGSNLGQFNDSSKIRPGWDYFRTGAQGGRIWTPSRRRVLAQTCRNNFQNGTDFDSYVDTFWPKRCHKNVTNWVEFGTVQ